MRTYLLGLTLLAAAPAAALAQTGTPYLLGDIGAARYENASPFADPAKLGLGAGFRFHRHFAGEIGVSFFGESRASTPAGSAKLRARSLHPALVGLIPVAPELTAFGKVGLSANRADGTNPAGNSFDTSDTDLYFGFGLQYGLSPRVGLRAQYENFGSFENTGSPMRASAVSLGIAYYLD